MFFPAPDEIWIAEINFTRSHGERVVSENLELFDDRLACIRPLVKDNRVEADSGHELGDRFSSLTIMAVDDEDALAARSVAV